MMKETTHQPPPGFREELRDGCPMTTSCAGFGRCRGAPSTPPICEVLVTRYAQLVRACVRPYRGSPERSRT